MGTCFMGFLMLYEPQAQQTALIVYRSNSNDCLDICSWLNHLTSALHMKSATIGPAHSVNMTLVSIRTLHPLQGASIINTNHLHFDNVRTYIATYARWVFCKARYST